MQNTQQHNPQSLPDSVEQIFLSITHQTPLNSDWTHLQHPNYHQIHPLDDVMSEHQHQHQLEQQPQPEHHPQNIQHNHFRINHVAPSTRSHSHHPHSNNFTHPHTPPSQRLPPRPPTTHAQHPSQLPLEHPIFSQSSFHHLTPPQPIPQSIVTAETFSPTEQPQPSFALPQTIAGSYVTKLESGQPSSAPQYFSSAQQHSLSPPISYNSQPDVPSIPAANHIDTEKYVRESAFMAEKIKVQYRDKLKQDQLQKENDAKSRGSPMTAKEKERERSRRESAVTRKRAEVYIRELEQVSRRLPYLEVRLRLLENQLQQLRNYVADFEDKSTQSQIGHITPTSTPQLVKSEPGLHHLSPASQRTSTVMNQMQQLDLRLQNAGESG